MGHLALITFAIFLTVGLYALSRRAFLRYGYPLLSPVFLSTLVIIAVLTACRIPFAGYKPAQHVMTALLGPAVVALARLAGLERVIVVSLAPKSVTAPVAVEIARLVGGDQALTAAFVITTGVLGSMLGPWFLSKVRIHDPVARGLAVGTAAHGQGTAMMLQEGETQGAVSGVAMALAAIFVSAIAPFMIPWLVTFMVGH